MQKEIRILDVMPKPSMVDSALIHRCKDGKEAILLCIQCRKVRYPYSDIANTLEIDKGHFSRILSGTAHFPDEKRCDLMRLCGNLAPLQFEADQMGYFLVEPTEKENRIKEAEQALEKLKAS